MEQFRDTFDSCPPELMDRLMKKRVHSAKPSLDRLRPDDLDEKNE
jgi:hypothetical protein